MNDKTVNRNVEDDDDDEIVRRECTRLGLKFKPWEPNPWDVGDAVPAWVKRNPAQAEAYALAVRLRRRLLAEAKGQT